MSKNIIISIAVIILVSLSVGAFALMNRNVSNTQVSTETDQKVVPPTETGDSKKTLKDLMGMNNQQCSLTLADNHQGQFFISNGYVRGNIAIVAAGQTIDTHVIVDSAAVYMWIDGQKTGYKTDLTVDTSSSTSTKNTVDLNQEVNYTCQPWTPDQSYFEVPATVTFTSTNALMPAGSGSADNQTIRCAACDQAPESARASCKAALGCS